MKYAVIESGVVTNMVLADEPLLESWVQADESARIGHLYDENTGAFSAPPPPVKTPEQIVAEYTAVLERHYDTKAGERRYDNRFTCALRAGYAGPFQAEGATFALWMDNCNAYAYSVMAAVQAGTRQMPSIEQLINELPALAWPE